MTTAVYVVRRALTLLLVQAEDAPLEPGDYADTYDAMNDYMADLEAKGVNLGYTPVSNPTDEITIPPGAIRGLVYNLAAEVADSYERPITPGIARGARSGLSAMRRLGLRKAEQSYPSTLPRGSGNYRFTFTDDTFYRKQGKGAVTLKNNTLETVLTQNTPTLINGRWETVRAQKISGNIEGRLKNVSQHALDVYVDGKIEVTGGTSVTVHLYENGHESIHTVTGTADGSEMILRYTTTLLPNDFLELWVENTADDSNLTVRDCQFQVY